MSAALRTTRQRRRFSLPSRGVTGLPVIVMRRIAAMARRLIHDRSRRAHDQLHTTYLTESGTASSLQSFLAGIARPSSDEASTAAAQYFLEHRFDLLGSGWTRVAHGMQCRGVEGFRFPPLRTVATDRNGDWLRDLVPKANLSESKRIWAMIDAGYEPIDWQIDFKSGFRWSESTWYHDIRFGDKRGADVKVPWELSRMQHLPQIALQFGAQRSPAFAREIRNQILDWIATNPPRFGVNWFSTMDVAIRVANMLVAFDLAVAYGASFGAEFTSVLRRSVLEHAQHIAANLEWNADFRGNHYLSNIAGLLFAAAYIDESEPQRDAWIRFCVEELVTAVEEQFYEDGGNFEASTSYHRLSAEMVMYCTALVRRIVPQDPFPAWYYTRLERMGDFTNWVRKPDGTVVQIGDNDSGRFLKLAPRRELMTCAEAKRRILSLDGYDELPDHTHYPDEVILDHGHLLAGLSSLLDRKDFVTADTFERVFCAALSGEPPRQPDSSSPKSGASKTSAKPPGGAPQSRQVIPTGELLASPDARAFEDFGAYIWRDHSAHLCIRCGALGQNGIGGHAHNDQLSFELSLPGQGGWKDPGTYLYTPLPERRNEYRSVHAHNGPRPSSGETGILGAGLFRIIDAWEGECLEFSERTFLGVMHRRSARIYRRITLGNAEIVVEDWAKGCTLAPSDAFRASPLLFSPGYGVRLR